MNLVKKRLDLKFASCCEPAHGHPSSTFHSEFYKGVLISPWPNLLLDVVGRNQ